MSSKDNTPSLEGLVKAYQNERCVYTAELLLDKLVESTTSENLLLILTTMKASPQLHELDISLFINGVAKPELPQLLETINELRKTFVDPDALEDLDEAEAKIVQQ